MTFPLPKDKKDIAMTLRSHADRSFSALSSRHITWKLAWYYCNGYRRFPEFDPIRGVLRAEMLDQNGEMEFVSQELLHYINQVAGRLQSMDVRPSVLQEGSSMDGVRSRAIASILLDSTLSHDSLVSNHEIFCWLFSCLGSAGLMGHASEDPSMGIVSEIEVVHPREILPFPFQSMDQPHHAGIMRVRWIPLEVYKETIDGRFDWSRATLWRTSNYGDEPPMGSPASAPSPGYPTAVAEPFGPTGGGLSRKDDLEYVQVISLWIYGPRGTVKRYVESTGELVIRDAEYSMLEKYCPLAFARFMNNGTFHGCGMFDLLFYQHRYLERLQKSLHNNIIDMDSYGVLVLPQSQMQHDIVVKRHPETRGLKVAFWQPDPVQDQQRPLFVSPFNSGEAPARIAQFAREGLKIINPIQDIVAEKGRVDSATGLQMLEEQSTRALTTATTSIVNAYGMVYRSLCQQVSSLISEGGGTGDGGALEPARTIPVGEISLDLAGAVIDFEKGAVSFPRNPIPSLSRLRFSVRAVAPRSGLARKQEAVQLWKMGIERDPLAFRMHAIRENLDYAMWLDGERGAYENSIRIILTVFGDGVTPGEVTITPYTVRPDILLRLLSGFSTGPAMAGASERVHRAILALRQTALSWAGYVLPPGVPEPEETVGQPQVAGPPGMAQGGGPESPGEEFES